MKKFLLLILVLFISACSSQVDCSEQDTTYQKYSYDESLKECVVSKSIQRDVCGNKIMESGETYCNCEEDVSKTHPENGCFGTAGEYVELACNSKEQCVEFKAEDKVVSQSKKVTFKNSDLTFEGIFQIEVPIVINTDDQTRLPLEVELFKTSSSVSIRDVVVNSISLDSFSGIQFSSVDYNQELAKPGDKLLVKDFTLSGVSDYSSRQRLSLTMKVSYIRETIDSKGEIVKSENKIESLKADLGTWEIINPKLFE